jgi:hypothetical protein
LLGEAQSSQDPLSSLHSKLDPDSDEEKVKLAAVEVVLDWGPLVIEVFGAVVSAGGGGTVTDQSRVAGVESMFPARSLARTEN